MAYSLHLLGILGLLAAFSSAAYDYSNILDFDPSTEYGINELHHRSKRAANIPTTPENPPNITFYLFKLGEHENVTTMSVGSHVRFQLVIHFPVGLTDILVELFTPDNDTTVMKLCNPVVMHVGSKLNVDVHGVTQTKDTLTQSIKTEGKTPTTKDYDRAIIELGNVTATAAASNTPHEAVIEIEWEAVMIENAATVDGTTYWVSAGAEYNQYTEVWVGQASFTASLDNWKMDVPKAKGNSYKDLSLNDILRMSQPRVQMQRGNHF